MEDCFQVPAPARWQQSTKCRRGENSISKDTFDECAGILVRPWQKETNALILQLKVASWVFQHEASSNLACFLPFNIFFTWHWVVDDIEDLSMTFYGNLCHSAILVQFNSSRFLCLDLRWFASITVMAAAEASLGADRVLCFEVRVDITWSQKKLHATQNSTILWTWTATNPSFGQREWPFNFSGWTKLRGISNNLLENPN